MGEQVVAYPDEDAHMADVVFKLVKQLRDDVEFQQVCMCGVIGFEGLDDEFLQVLRGPGGEAWRGGGGRSGRIS